MKNEKHEGIILYSINVSSDSSFLHRALSSLSVSLGEPWSHPGGWGGKAGGVNLRSLVPRSVMAEYQPSRFSTVVDL